MVIDMKKSVIVSILGVGLLVATFIVWGLTEKENYIWNGLFYVLLIIISAIIIVIGLATLLSNYYTKERYQNIIAKYQSKYDPSKSIFVPISDLIYYLNKKYLGGDSIMIKHNNEYCILERQVFSDHKKKIFSSIYNLNEKCFGDNFDKLLCEPIFNGTALIELDTVELVLKNKKYPLPLKEKRIYENVKPHTILMSSSILMIIFGVLFLTFSFTVDDWYLSIIFGGSLLFIGIILMVILVKKIKSESLVSD